MLYVPANVGSFNLPGRFGFGRTQLVIKRIIGRQRVSICQADLGLAELVQRLGT